MPMASDVTIRSQEPGLSDFVHSDGKARVVAAIQMDNGQGQPQSPSTHATNLARAMEIGQTLARLLNAVLDDAAPGKGARDEDQRRAG